MRRLLRIEARRNAVLPLLPVMVLLVGLSPLALHLTPVALWSERSTGLQGTVQTIGPFMAGAAAWTASREHRGAMADLLASTPHSPWARWTAGWAATIGWGVLFYAVLVGGVFALTAHPAYARELSTFDTLVNRIAAPLAGTPGLPSRAEQVPGPSNGQLTSQVRGDPPVLTLPNFVVHGDAITPPGLAALLQTQVAVALVTPAGTPADHANPAQRAVALYLLRQAGYTPSSHILPDSAAVTAAAQRLTALDPATRRTWLATRIAALRAGTLTLTELP